MAVDTNPQPLKPNSSLCPPSHETPWLFMKLPKLPPTPISKRGLKPPLHVLYYVYLCECKPKGSGLCKIEGLRCSGDNESIDFELMEVVDNDVNLGCAQELEIEELNDASHK
ncbi:hypothetical protein ACH5RR_000552 [Cinchona calisaya]|uniref:Uncharacterized protein n=1 Tax=Cinchona calisaya TaxID=153742 RepID=A0ABD3B1G7_9GENT